MATLLLAVTSARADNEKAAGGAELLQAAARRMDIREAGSPPFRLSAHVLVRGEYRGSREGTFTMTWMSPGEYRAELALPDASMVELVHGGRLLIARQPECPPARSDWPEGLLAWPLDPGLHAGERVIRVHQRDGNRLTCYQVAWPNLDMAVECVDVAAGVLARVEEGKNVLTFSDFAPWGEHSFPRTLRWSEGRSVAVEIHVDVLDAPPDGSLDLTPPPGATAWEHAGDWMWAQLARSPLTYPKELARDDVSGEVLIGGVIGADGKPSDVRVACPSTFKDLDKITLAAVRRWAWLPATSGGKPVASELRERVDYRLHLAAP